MPTAKAFPTRLARSGSRGYPSGCAPSLIGLLDGKMDGDEVAYAVAILIDSLEHAPGAAGSRWHGAGDRRPPCPASRRLPKRRC